MRFLPLLNFMTIAKLCVSFEIDLIADIINSYNRPTAINAFLCWDIYRMSKLVHRLGNTGFRTTKKFSTGALNYLSAGSADESVFVFDAACSNAAEILKQASQKRLFSRFNRWLIVGLLHKQDLVFDTKWKHLNISVDSEFVITENYRNSSVELFLAYKISPNTNWIFENFGNWTKNEGFRRVDDLFTSTQMRRKNLRKHNIKTCYVITHNSTRDMLDDWKDPIDTIAKCGHRIVIPLFDFMNITSVSVFTDTWGYVVNGSFNGMMGLIARGKAEFAGTVIFITQSRLPIIDYHIYAVDSDTKFVFKDPPLSYQHNLFLMPFRTKVWLCIGGFIIILLVILYLNASWETKTTEGARECSVGDIAMMILGAVTQQGTSQELKGSIGRLVMFVLFLTFLFLHTSYSASVVALLQSSSSEIRTLTDLLNSKLELGVQDLPYNIHYFTKATEPVRKAIYDTKIAAKGSQKAKFMSVEEGVQKMQKEPFAFNMFLGIGYKVVQNIFHEHEKCGLHEISYIPQLKPYYVSAKNSPYKELFKIGLYRIREHGIVDREHRLLLAKKPVCVSRGGSFSSVSIIDVYPAIVMLLYGFLISFSMLLTEIFFHRLNLNRTRRIEK